MPEDSVGANAGSNKDALPKVAGESVAHPRNPGKPLIKHIKEGGKYYDDLNRALVVFRKDKHFGDLTDISYLGGGADGWVLYAYRNSDRKQVAIKISVREQEKLPDGRLLDRDTGASVELEGRNLYLLQKAQSVAGIDPLITPELFASGKLADGRRFLIEEFVSGKKVKEYGARKKINSRNATKMGIATLNLAKLMAENDMAWIDLHLQDILVVRTKDGKITFKLIDLGQLHKLSNIEIDDPHDDDAANKALAMKHFIEGQSELPDGRTADISFGQALNVRIASYVAQVTGKRLRQNLTNENFPEDDPLLQTLSPAASPDSKLRYKDAKEFLEGLQLLDKMFKLDTGLTAANRAIGNLIRVHETSGASGLITREMINHSKIAAAYLRRFFPENESLSKFEEINIDKIVENLAEQ